jgi:hypothetical protein
MLRRVGVSSTVVTQANYDADRVLAEAFYWDRVIAARTDLAAFIELVARDEHGQPIELDYIHRAWIWHVQYCWSRNKHAQIRAPFGSGKSSTLAVPLAAFLVGQDVQTRIKFVCAGDDNATQRVAAVKDMVESVVYRHVFPHVTKDRKKKWDTHQAFVKREGNAIDPTLHARGVLTRGIGGRADYVIFDDVCDQLNSEDEQQREKIKRFGRRTWLSRLENEDDVRGHALMLCTPWWPDDFSDDLMKDPNWCTLIQRVRLPDMEHYEQEVINAGDDYETAMIAG